MEPSVAEWRIQQLESKTKALSDQSDRVTVLETQMETLEKTCADIVKKLESANNWLRGLVGSVLIALILLAVDLWRSGKH